MTCRNNYTTQKKSLRSASNSWRKKNSKNVGLKWNKSRSEFGYSSKRAKSECKNKKPKFKDLGILKRNQDWLASKQRKLTTERQRKKAHETDGWTFEPKINKYKRFNNLSSRTNTSIGAKSNRSYSDIHKDRCSKPTSMNSSFRSSARREEWKKETQLNILDLSTRDWRREEFNTISIDPIMHDTNLNTLENR